MALGDGSESFRAEELATVLKYLVDRNLILANIVRLKVHKLQSQGMQLQFFFCTEPVAASLLRKQIPALFLRHLLL